MIGNKNCSALTFLRCLYHILSDFQGRKLLDLIANLVEKTSADYRENFAVVERLVTLFSRCMVSHLQQVMNFTDIFTDEDITRELKFYMTRINEVMSCVRTCITVHTSILGKQMNTKAGYIPRSVVQSVPTSVNLV
jgi:hypothetical protein